MSKLFYTTVLILGFLACKSKNKLENEFLEKAKTDKIDSLAKRYHDLNRFSGVVLVKKGNSTVYYKNFGLADYENSKPFSDVTSFKIGRISELITAQIIKNLASEGKFQLTDKVSKYLPEIKAHFSITDLLDKSTHLPSIQMIQQLNPNLNYSIIEYANLANTPKETSKIGELEYNILGLLIEKVSGKDFQHNIENYALKLGLKNTNYNENGHTAIGYLYNNYRGNGDELHKSPTYNLDMAFSSYGIKSTATDLLKIINTEKEINMDGYVENDGFSYSLHNNPTNKTSIIILSNRRHPIAIEISNSIIAILENKAFKLPLLRKPFNINPDLLKDYSGTYALNENMTFNVIDENDSLYVLLGQNKIHLVPQSSNQFYIQQRDASMRFLKDSTNLVNEVMLLNGFLEGETAKRLKTTK